MLGIPPSILSPPAGWVQYLGCWAYHTRGRPLEATKTLGPSQERVPQRGCPDGTPLFEGCSVLFFLAVICPFSADVVFFLGGRALTETVDDETETLGAVRRVLGVVPRVLGVVPRVLVVVPGVLGP